MRRSALLTARGSGRRRRACLWVGEESGKRAEGKEKVRGGTNVSGKVDFV